MRYCLSARQSKEYLKKADEILVDWRDNDAILDILEINPEASIVLSIPNNDLKDEDWEKVKQYYVMTRKKLKVMLSLLNYDYCKKNNIPFFFSSPVGTGWEANALIDLGVCAIYITGYLAHQLDFVDTLPIEIRVFPNQSMAPFGFKPLYGSWFRPEDINDLTMIDVCDLTRRRDMREEQALYRIYAEQKQWPGELYMLVKDIEDTTIMNRMIPPEFQQRRNNCGLKCQNGKSCHFCDIITHLANPKLLKPVKESLERGQRANVPGIIDDVF